MASACVNNIPTTTHSSYGWLSPRISLNRDEEYNNISSTLDLDSPIKDTGADFEFRLGDNVTMVPAVAADELFADGKLVPLQLSSAKSASSSAPEQEEEEEADKSYSRISEDPYLYSPKAPRCSSRWRELLGLKKLQQNTTHNNNNNNNNNSKQDGHLRTASKSIRQFLNSKMASSSSSGGISSPLLKDSLPSCSSSDQEELPRMSLDAEKPVRSGPKVRTGRARMENQWIESPRMNPSGRVVFQSLERSSSSPSTFNGGTRYNNINNNNRGGIMERSYSANVRITPVLNVPLCSLRGSSKSALFGLFQPHPHKKEGNTNLTNANTRINNHYHHHNHHNTNIRNKKEKEKEKEKEIS